jgi:endonuclease IV
MSHIGFHVNRTYTKTKGASIEQQIELAKQKYGVEHVRTFQIFIASPRGGGGININEKSLAEYITKTGSTIIAHARYLDVPWTNPTSYMMSFIQSELLACKNAKIHGFVFHLYRAPPDIVLKRLCELCPPKEVCIYLEIPAVTPDKAIYHTPKQLYDLYRIVSEKIPNVGICVDTAHLYASGVNVGDADLMHIWFTELLSLIPPDRILIHLNDSRSTLGSGKDHHASIGIDESHIWKTRKDSLNIILNFINRYNILTIFERNDNKDDIMQDYKVVRGC